MHPRSVCKLGRAPWALCICGLLGLSIRVYCRAVAVTLDRRASRPRVACLVASRLWAGFRVSSRILLVATVRLLWARSAMLTGLITLNI